MKKFKRTVDVVEETTGVNSTRRQSNVFAGAAIQQFVVSYDSGIRRLPTRRHRHCCLLRQVGVIAVRQSRHRRSHFSDGGRGGGGGGGDGGGGRRDRRRRFETPSVGGVTCSKADIAAAFRRRDASH